MLTPYSVHYHLTEKILAERENVLKKAYDKNPARFKHQQPTAGVLPKAAWINKPENEEEQLKMEGVAV